MNAGFSNLTALKAQLLATDLRGGTLFDDALREVGLFIAARCESYCNRQFAYSASATQIIQGGREHYYVPRYPIVGTPVVEIRYSLADAWTVQTDQPYQMNPESGLLEFVWNISPRPGQIRITWAGGYWWESKEKDEEGFPTAQTEGVAALPDGLRGAWLMQCRAAWQALDKLGVDIASTGSASQFVSGSLADLKLLPIVEQELNPFRRLSGA